MVFSFMLIDQIKKVLSTGECPKCQATVDSDDEMTTFICTEDRTHFELRVTFHGGEKITATLNGEAVEEEKLKEIEW